MNSSRSSGFNRASVTRLRLAGFTDEPEPSPLNSHFVIDPDEAETGQLEFHAFSSEEERQPSHLFKIKQRYDQQNA